VSAAGSASSWWVKGGGGLVEPPAATSAGGFYPVRCSITRTNQLELKCGIPGSSSMAYCDSNARLALYAEVSPPGCTRINYLIVEEL
jgi:hypothetical protein